MNLDKLLERAKEIEVAIVNTSAQLNALQGHKTEVTHWIQSMQEAPKVEDSTEVENPVPPVVE